MDNQNSQSSNSSETYNLGLQQTPSKVSTDLAWSTTTLAAMKDLAQQVQELQNDIPQSNVSADQDSWPLAYIDPTLVATGDIMGATIPLTYLEGYPTVDGVPFWERLENESSEYYKVFKEYRDM
jgi:hypothetical protein